MASCCAGLFAVTAVVPVAVTLPVVVRLPFLLLAALFLLNATNPLAGFDWLLVVCIVLFLRGCCFCLPVAGWLVVVGLLLLLLPEPYVRLPVGVWAATGWLVDVLNIVDLLVLSVVLPALFAVDGVVFSGKVVVLVLLPVLFGVVAIVCCAICWLALYMRPAW